MENERYEAIVRRVERLERDLRRWRRVASGLALGAVALATLAAGGTRGRVVEAQKFVVRDLAGRVRAELGPSDNDRQLALRFRDLTGSPRVTLGMEDETAVLVLADKTGRPRAGLVTLAQGVPGLTLYDTTGRARLELGVIREGQPSVRLFDARGGAAWKAP
jgi:hypothetical protein